MKPIVGSFNFNLRLEAESRSRTNPSSTPDPGYAIIAELFGSGANGFGRQLSTISNLSADPGYQSIVGEQRADTSPASRRIGKTLQSPDLSDEEFIELAGEPPPIPPLDAAATEPAYATVSGTKESRARDRMAPTNPFDESFREELAKKVRDPSRARDLDFWTELRREGALDESTV